MTPAQLHWKLSLYVAPPACGMVDETGRPACDFAAQLAQILADACDVQGATIIASEGVWRGEREAAFKVEILAPTSASLDRLSACAQNLAREWGQDEVWLTRERVECWAVSVAGAL